MNALQLAEDRLLVADEVARLLGVTVPYIYELARDDRIPSVRLGDSGRLVRFVREDVVAWAKAQSNGGRTREPLMDSEGVRQYLGLKDVRTARDLMRQAGAFDLGRGRLRIDPADLDRYLEERRASVEVSAPVDRIETRRRTRRETPDLSGNWWEAAS